ncbi:uncharacterized protein CcaverHIS019_0102200 [Cutaneotrichosporon cavernicola]|uniref:Cystathionine beta-lyase n=1 Tax=Cutaneotrichosporon cavernicola TaxID=279322 RepID=A0AA48L0F8_9TREE|nr:uncharacterized protein CcaverHIS019_0102200 [Cutaneotrichosporon cavernicola]BEI87502.1 hypothetical protein CcaverHIS019_0102200 [Cutaneotrichosporon cavernicola]
MSVADTTPVPSSPGESSMATSVYDSNSEYDFEARAQKWHFATQVVATDSSQNQHGASATPIFQTATFKGMEGPYDYSRSGNPTRGGLESHLARLYSATSAFALSTGMTCLDVILRLVKPGETVLAGDDLYGGTNRLLTYLSSHGGVDVRHVDTTKVEGVMPHLEPGNKVKMVLLESPTNPLLKVADIAAVSKAVHAAAPNAIIVVDNTMMSPYLQRPLELGADIVYDSATKYLSGHHDLMAGIIAVRTPEHSKEVAWLINAMGSGLAPFDSFLLMRGVKTLALRMDKQQANAQIVANYLHELGFLVHYPGLKSHPGADIHWKQATGAGAVLSFVTGDKALSERIVSGTRLWGVSVSFGAVNSLISMPCLMSHASISPALRAERGLPENLIRLCVGIEDPRDLLDDLETAFIASGAIVPRNDDSLLSLDELDALYAVDAPAWGIERAHFFRRPIDSDLAEGVSRGLTLGGEAATAKVKTLDSDIVVSAPGKVILFGEHAVVHGVTAIATSLNLRCYGVLAGRFDGKVAIAAPDLEADHAWDIATLPWSLVPAREGNVAPAALDQTLLEAIEAVVSQDKPTKTGFSASVAFLYIYMAMTVTEDNALAATLTVSANLPIGAGLGSSAAFSACLASSLLFAHAHATAHCAPDPAAIDLVDAWAFLAEKVLHGNPSGIDNAVAVRGGAVAFTRAVNGKQGGLDPMGGFASIRLLLTDTGVPRDTKSLVAGVGAMKLAKPEIVNPILDRIQAISDEASSLLTSSTERAFLIERLGALMRENHTHLRTLGVSHPSLESVVSTTSKFGLATKLTGAGGGGCAVTLVPDAFDDASLARLTRELEGLGAQPHLTTLGGPGLCVHVLPQGSGGVGHSLKSAGSANLHSWSEGLGGQWVHA